MFPTIPNWVDKISVLLNLFYFIHGAVMLSLVQLGRARWENFQASDKQRNPSCTRMWFVQFAIRGKAYLLPTSYFQSSIKHLREFYRKTKNSHDIMQSRRGRHKTLSYESISQVHRAGTFKRA